MIAGHNQLAFDSQDFGRVEHFSAALDMREGLVEDYEGLIVAAKPLIALRHHRDGKLLSRYSAEAVKARDSLFHFGDPFFDFTELGQSPAPVKYSPCHPLGKSVFVRQYNRRLGVGSYASRLPPILM